MPRRRINVAKLYVLKSQLQTLAQARERRLVTKQATFEALHRPRWESGLGRAWVGCRNRRRSTPVQLAAVRRMVRIRQLERSVA